MGNKLIVGKPKSTDLAESRNEFIKFVTRQFKELVKRNLQVPIKLYQL